VSATSLDWMRRAWTPRRGVVALMRFAALTLAVMSVLHLAGVIDRHSRPPFHSDDAGIAEAVIAIVLLIGAHAVRRGATGRSAGLAATLFAIAGFGLGLTFTLTDGNAIDVGYHLGMLPVLLAILALLLRARPGRRHSGSPDGNPGDRAEPAEHR
jgi:hypothetical protein